MIEKRAFPRLPRDWEIECQISKSPTSQPVLIKGEIRDLSTGGFSFRSESACPPGALLQFAINPTDDFKPMVGVARMAWTRGQEGGYECGAKFVWVDWRGVDPQTTIGQYVLDNISKKPS